MKKQYWILPLFLFLLLLYRSDFFGVFPKDLRLEVHFIDVGQGDSTLVISPGGKTLLIDAGNNDKGDEVTAYLRSLDIDRIDILIGTHPDADHIGGIDTVIDSFSVGHFYMPMKYHETKTFRDVLLAAERKGLPIEPVYAGDRFFFDPDIETLFLNPIKGKHYENNNSYSAVVFLRYRQSEFLFMGDADTENEADILRSYPLKADILKLGHHGSSTSSSESFLTRIDPVAVVVSAGYKNKYGHPHKAVLDRLQKKNLPLYRTDEQGDIIIRTDGMTITANRPYGSYNYRRK